MHSRTRAKTLHALVDRTKPTFAWGDGDLLWVMNEGGNKPLFALNHAYQLDAASRAGAWVLFDAAPSYVPNGLVEFTHEVTPGRVLARDRRHGTVYLVNWNSRERTGTGIVGCSRQILVWRKSDGKWAFVGEAPSLVRGQSGPRHFTATSAYRVRWTGATSSTIDIHATRTETTMFEDAAGSKTLHTCRDYLLEGKTPGRFVRVGADYIPAGDASSIRDAVARVATCKTFVPQERDSRRREKMLRAVSESIVELNEHRQPDRILLPDMDDIWDLANHAAGPRPHRSIARASED